MIGGPSVALWRDIQSLFDAGTVGGLTDRQLLERFTHHRDASSDAAFEVLVRRHGPMVLRVCRNVLRDWNDAEDAFQATFVVLARRCGSIHKRDSIESWLFGVACRVAARARVEAARRRAVERRGAAEADSALGTPEDDEAERSEIGPVVQEEVHRLPDKYRAAVVLCYWEGLTQEQAAAQLGCPLGTVRSRLARARDLLRRRLSRRGAAPMAGFAASGFEFPSIVPIPTTVPDSWVASTVKAVTQVAAGTGRVAAGAASASVNVLVHSVLRSMFMIKVKTIAISLSFIGLGAAGVILAAPQVGQDRPTPAAGQGRQTAQRPAPRPAPAPDAGKRKVQPPLHLLPRYVIEPPDILIVEVLEALPGRPISGERLVRPDGKISLGFYGELDVAGLTPIEVKEKIIKHLQKDIADEVLGLTVMDDTGAVIKRIDPKDSDRVFVDIAKMNSKNYYVVGSVQVPGRLAVKGNETVLDAINLAGGLAPQADQDNVVLFRQSPDGTLQRLPVNMNQILMGDDPSTNYQILPGDRLVVYPHKGTDPAIDDPNAARPSAAARERSGEPRRGERRPPVSQAGSPDDEDPRRDDAADRPPTLRDVQRRLGELDRKLDRVLEALGRRE